jgi:hypothetical protein
VLEGDFTYDGLGSYVAFVDTEVDCPNLKILGNVWNRTKGGNSGYNVFMTSIGSVSDLTEFPEADFAGLTKVQGNVVAHEDSDGVISSVGTNNYIQVATEVNETIVKNISGSAITTVSAVSRVTFISVGTTGLENLDQILPVDNAPWRKGDIVYLNQDSSSDDYTLRDIGTSGASTYGFQTPGGTSISSTTNNHVIQCMYVGPHWLVVSSQTDA